MPPLLLARSAADNHRMRKIWAEMSTGWRLYLLASLALAVLATAAGVELTITGGYVWWIVTLIAFVVFLIAGFFATIFYTFRWLYDRRVAKRWRGEGRYDDKSEEDFGGADGNRTRTSIGDVVHSAGFLRAEVVCEDSAMSRRDRAGWISFFIVLGVGGVVLIVAQLQSAYSLWMSVFSLVLALLGAAGMVRLLFILRRSAKGDHQ